MQLENTKKDSVRYGVILAAFIEFGWLLIIGLLFGMAGLFMLIIWAVSFMLGA